MKADEKQDRFIVYAVMAIASAVWIFLFRQYYSGATGLFPDGYSYYHWTKFYFDSLSSGSYPLWNPFVNWGFPVGFKIRFLGEFNPLLLFFYLPYKLGVSFSIVYFTYALSYFFVGMFGFYLICRQLLPDRWWACFGFILLLYSNLGIAIFFNYCEVVLLVPGIWFFYFWLRFHRQPKRGAFLGLIFSAMMILTSYMPFYFLTIFGVFLLLCMLLYATEIPAVLGQYRRFIGQNIPLVFVAMALLGLATVPGYVTYKETSSQEFSYAHRQADSKESAVTTGIGMVNAGSILGPLTFSNLFSGHRYIENYLSYYFLSVVIYPLLLIGVFQPLTRRLVICFVIVAVMFGITLTEATPILGFFYEHVFFFKLMRNIFYLFYLVVPFMVLYVLLQWCAWWEKARYHPRWNQIWVSVSCGVFVVFLLAYNEVLLSQYVSVGAIWMLIMLRLMGRFEGRDKIFWIGLIVVTTVQPIDVYRHYLRNVYGQRPIEYSQQQQQARFFYQRPRFGQDRQYPADVMPDNSGYIDAKFAGTAPSALLQKQINAKRLSNYTQHKLITYDAAKHMDPDQIMWPVVDKNLSQLRPPAIVFDTQAGAGQRLTVPPRSIREDSEQLMVKDFGVNHITLQSHFPTKKFLVYNDSYHSQWRAKINGTSTPLYQANIAFKGIWVESGERIIHLRYGSRWLEVFYFFLMLVFLSVLILVTRWEIQERRVSHA